MLFAFLFSLVFGCGESPLLALCEVCLCAVKPVLPSSPLVLIPAAKINKDEKFTLFVAIQELCHYSDNFLLHEHLEVNFWLYTFFGSTHMHKRAISGKQKTIYGVLAETERSLDSDVLSLTTTLGILSAQIKIASASLSYSSGSL